MKFNNVKVIYNGETYNQKDYRMHCEKNAIPSNLLIANTMNRSHNMIFSICNILESNSSYIPIDPSLPEEQIEYIIKDSMVTAIFDGNSLSYQAKMTFNDDFEELAYILYTSGTTGQPKGVKVTKPALLNFMNGISEIIDFSPKKRIACLTSASFDIFFLESIMALYKGLTVILANDEEQRNPKLMAKLIAENNVDIIQMTPSRMQLLSNHDKELSCLRNVKEIIIGGEAFPLNLLLTLQEKTSAKIYNMYGPTESTIWSTVSELTYKGRIDIGRPIKNTEVYIVDDNLFIVPDGQSGEICIAGEGLAKGYVGKDDLTAEKFVFLPQNPGLRVYRTGDMGSYLSNGDLQYLGRTDNQVKIRGHRIKLEEIEALINQIDGIKQAIVIALEKNETEKILEAYYTSDAAVDQKDIANYLSSKLPEYMIPVMFKRIDNFIQTANGKIDRKRVLECVEIKTECFSTEDSNTAKLSDIQKRAFEVVVSNLDSKLGDVKLDTAFAGFEIDSITFIKIIVALEGEFDFEFDDEMLLITKFPTVKSMIEYVESKVTTNCENG